MGELQEIKRRFQNGESVDTSSIRREILESWERSLAYGITENGADTRILSPEMLKKRIKKRQSFFDVAVPVMEEIYRFIRESAFLVVLTDEEGYVIHEIGEGTIMQEAIQNGFVSGCNRSERSWGTNGIGTVLMLKRPLQVFGDEHYCRQSVDWVCSGAPIFLPDGDLAGTFCICGERENITSHTLGIAVATASAITRQYKMRITYDKLATARRNLEIIIENTPTGIILADREQKIQQMNTKAARLLQCAPEALIGKKLDEAIGAEFADGNTNFSNRSAIIQLNDKKQRFSVSLKISEGESRIITFEKEESLHRRVTRLIGSEARFNLDDIIGTSEEIKNAVRLAGIAAENNSNVLILGKSGTGKEMFAQAIHNASSRRDGPFVAINCGALPKSLIESELFGYEGGSFTGAKKDGHAGKFELANGGTIFLDEIGDMPFEVQVSLLRVLQNREVTRIGSNRSIKIDVRVIAATNQDLVSRIEQELFRRDLYYRLNVFTIQIPLLKSRVEDVRPLADYFLEKYAREVQGCRAVGFTDKAYQRMEAYDWPGNVRELENVVERAVYLGRNLYIDANELMLEREENEKTVHGNRTGKTAAVQYSDLDEDGYSIKRSERKKVAQALQASGGNIKKAAEMLEISRRTLYRKLEKYHIASETTPER